jgi:BlaI family transcriptional regulator, penicillinase repressor
MGPRKHDRNLSRRERQIMDILFARGKAAAAEIRQAMPNKPSDSAVRTHLRILEEKGHVKHQQDGVRYVYSPAVSPRVAKRSALRHLVSTFFEGSPEKAVAALLGDARLTPEELDRLSELVDQAKEKGERK